MVAPVEQVRVNARSLSSRFGLMSAAIAVTISRDGRPSVIGSLVDIAGGIAAEVIEGIVRWDQCSDFGDGVGDSEGAFGCFDLA